MHYAYRGWRRDWGRKNKRQCGGALVWQLNDLWPVTSWALVDSSRLRKAAWYAIKRDLEPITVGVVRTHHDWTKVNAIPSTSCKLDVWIACDGSLATAGMLDSSQGTLDVELRFVSIRTGLDVLPPQFHHAAGVKSNGTTTVCEKIILTNPAAQDAYVISAKILLGSSIIARDVDWPQPFKYLSFEEGRGLQVRQMGSQTRIKVTAKKPTKGLIFFERQGLRFSDNCLDIVPGEEYMVDIEGLQEHEELEWTYLGKNEGHYSLAHGITTGLMNGH